MQAGPISGIKKRSTRDAAAIWVALALTYMVFAGSVSVNEGLAALACASLGTFWWWTVGRRGGIRFHFSLEPLRPLGPAILDMPRQTARVGIHLTKALLGRAGGGQTRERSAAEMAWATPDGDTAPAARAVGLLAASLTPDSYVLTLDREHGTVATHALEDEAR
ncbi:hypothetical protein ACRAWG_21105 [Methylobacterium sp. P31]